MKPYKIVLADDHILFREAVKSSLKEVQWLEVVGDADDGLELMKLLQNSTPDLIVLDISMPGMQGLDAAKAIKTQYPDVKILMLTMHKSTEYLRLALAAGVNGYLLKENALADLVTAIEKIRGGEVYISPLVGGRLLQENYGRASGSDSLSPREIEVLKLVARGKSSKEIAELLSITIMTVYNHRVNIKNKLHLRKDAELTKFAIDQGYI